MKILFVIVTFPPVCEDQLIAEPYAPPLPSGLLLFVTIRSPLWIVIPPELLEIPVAESVLSPDTSALIVPPSRLTLQ